ncbi:hypothetical protein [Sedimentitalea sp.]|uniref:hypothetical protein n=1 Tax=Sedimentitalea sp. TaxID=2048915 RepID=UPI003299CF4A
MSIARPSFRFFGNLRLHKPANASDYDWDSQVETVSNLMEVYFADPEGDGKFRAFARFSNWGGGDLPESPTRLPADERNIFLKEKIDLLIEELTTLDTVSFWFDRPARALGDAHFGHTLRVMGMIAMDQFSGDEANQLLSRWPLTARYEFLGRKLGSVVTFGHAGGFVPNDEDFHMRLQVGLAMPRGLGMEGSFVFGGVFKTANRLASKLTHPDTHLIGAPGRAKLVENVSGRLGDYGFSTKPGSNKKLADLPSDVNRARPDHHNLVAALGLGTIEKSDFFKLEFLASPVQTVGQHEFALSCVTTHEKVNSLPVLGEVVPHVGCERVEVETIAICALPDRVVAGALLNEEPEVIDWALHLSLGWKSPEENTAGQTFGLGGLVEAQRLAEAARTGLIATQRQPQSIFPKLNFGGAKSVPMISYANSALFKLSGQLGEMPSLSVRERSATTRQPIALATTLDTDGPGRDRQLSRRLAPGDTEWIEPHQPGAMVEATMQLPGFENPRGRAGGATGFPVRFGHHPKAEGFKDPQVFFGMWNGDPAGTVLEARLGSVTVSGEAHLLAQTDVDQSPPAALLLRHGDRDVPDQRAAAEVAPTLDMMWRMDLALKSARPDTADVPHGDRGERPSDLLIHEEARPERTKSAAAARADLRAPVKEAASGLTLQDLVLSIREWLRDDQDRHLTAELQDTTSDEPGQGNVAVLSDAPFSVYRYIRQPYVQTGGEASNVVATYDSDDRQWRQLRTSEVYRMVRQAGALGEDADKPGMLEIHDSEDRADMAPILPPENGALRRRAVDMRLSPPTDLWIRPSDLARNYFLPEFAARDLFRQRGDFGLGVSLVALRSEALYGLALGVLVPDPHEAGPAPRVAELEAVTGRMIEYDPEVGTRLENRWRNLRRTFQKRPERLEIWRLDQRSGNPFVPARFDQGLRFSLRRTALLAPPLADDRVYPQVAETAPIQPPRFADHGLAGGALWPIESANVARTLAETVIASGGELEKVALSPMGISADQTVEFLNGYAKIITETRDGHLHRQRVEILGRIGALWHRAKHVVVYERTTAPSAQFAPQKPGSRSARAVLRKVSEYVEILEPVRRYPDVANAPPDSQGFLKEVRFNSRIINVNSAWGRDLGTGAWEVPLWNRGEAEIRPQVYPHPDIAFITRAEGREGADETAQDCRDPHLLYFYTDVESTKQVKPPERVDTDTWPLRDGVDCTALGSPTFQHPSADPVGDPSMIDVMDKVLKGPKRRAAPSRLVHGMRRFCWRLAPSPVRSQINAGLGEKPVYAGLESVSFMRSFALVDKAGGTKDAATLKANLAKAVAGSLAETQPPPGLSLPVDLMRMPGANTEFEPIADGLRDLRSAKEDQEKLGALAKLKAEVDATKSATLAASVMKLATGDDTMFLKSASKLISDNSDLANKLLSADKEDCEKLAERAAQALARRKLLAIQTIRGIETKAIAEIEQVPVATKAVLRAHLKEQIEKEIGGVSSDIGAAIGGVADGVATARATIADWRADALAGLARAQARVDAAAGALDRVKPWSRNRLDQALAQLDTVFATAETEAQAALLEARQRMASEIGASARAIAGPVAASLESVIAAQAEFDSGLAQVSDFINGHARRINAGIDVVPDETDPRLAKIRNKAEAKGDKAKEIFEKLDKTIKDLEVGKKRKDAKAFVKKVSETANGTLSDIKVVSDEVGDKATAELNAMAQAICELEVAAEQFSGAKFGDLQLLTNELAAASKSGLEAAQDHAERLFNSWSKELDVLDAVIDGNAARGAEWIAAVERATVAGTAAADQWLARFQSKLAEVEKEIPGKLKDAIIGEVVDPALDAALKAVTWPTAADVEAQRVAAIQVISGISEQAEKLLDQLAGKAVAGLDDIKKTCESLMGSKEYLFETAKNAYDKYLTDVTEELKVPLEDLKKAIEEAEAKLELVKNVLDAGETVFAAADGFATEVAAAGENAKAYLNGGIERAGDLFNQGPAAVPGKALELVSFLSHSPEIANLKANADRARMYVDKIDKVLKTPEMEAALDYLGDAAKALGLNFDFTEIADDLKMALPDGKDLRTIIPDFAGIDLSGLIGRTKAPGGLAEMVKLTHDLDTKTGRAWVQADVNVPLAGREEMFSIGPFTLYVTRSTLKAFLRAEASKDRPDVKVTDKASLRTDLEAVVGGQVVVTLRDVLMTYSSDTDLDFDFDPKKIKIHQSLKFIQDTLGSIFGDEAGGLSFLKEGGQIVGVEHNFKLPPLSLNFGTSGVSNIQIANRFALKAYPDFVIANRFNLSRRELPFIFSIFIIGGTGFIQVDTEYKPTDRSLMVMVEAGAGGSAALAFAFGPVSGGVYITLSVVLRYVKRLGVRALSDDGLSVSLVLVVAGNVSLWGMVTIYLGLMLSMTYHESGKIDGLGQLSVELRISRWFKLKYSTQVTYTLRNGRSRTERTEQVSASGEALDAFEKLNKLNDARKSL